ncbi:MAG: hypothetical protein ACD_51C00225G0007 [uncultured bacterium]|nr:MAG: hypothetical protein ACD_51C00225G0007 [uncultured bacterium]OGJ48621.1 MAG: hypothetical protein A2344_04960 [Candidatus Peregrinibacteria bacterium RIFOXYB12_FULL_41_12]OGJ48712.1 MAG: hypothetical protein A2244_03385 [Candidatus Peregrinibacteria bacterium RIFOXYA2_FULL_41_18]OGJ53388.1 MAG: hypothetical protein A2448_03300 [Candidatus Peregrinibacteria bacterium RIFOXYC2_FULL_41_22]
MSSTDEPPLAATDALQKNFLKIKELVLARRPVLKDVLKKQGGKNLYDYACDYVNVNLNPPIQFRQDELIKVVASEVERKLGKEMADSIADQLRHYYFINTTDHLGPANHPWSLNTNLSIAAPYAEYKNEHLKNVLVLSCANVSLNNPSSPRGLVFHTLVNGEVKMQRLSFLPSNSHSACAFGFRAYTASEIQKMHGLLKDKVKTKEVGVREADMIHSILDEIYATPDVLACTNYADQISKTNFKLWKKFFKDSEVYVPDLVYLEQETIVEKLIIDYHLYADTTITHLLFDSDYDPLVMKYFDKIMCAFDLEKKQGTYLFWGISDQGNYRVQLWKKDGWLVSEDGKFKLELKPEILKEALEQRKIIPSIMLVFIVLAFYYGLKCLGGFSQVNYLTMMKDAYIRMQTDRENYRSIEVCSRAQTKETDDATVAFLGGPKGELIPATGLDLLLYGNKDCFSEIVNEMKNITLEESFYPQMPDFYKFVFPETERDPVLSAVTSEEISKLIGLQKKLKPCAVMG